MRSRFELWFWLGLSGTGVGMLNFDIGTGRFGERRVSGPGPAMQHICP
jgi:hypothetical protein